MEIQEMQEIQIPMIPGPAEDAIYADNHSLFWEVIPGSLDPLEDENGPIPKVFTKTESYTLYKLFVGDFDEHSNGMQKITHKLQKAKPQDILEFHISSNGGVVDELLELYNLVDSMFSSRTTTFVNYGYSAGGWAFLMGRDRVVYEHSDLMFHSYTGGSYGKREDMINQLEHNDKRINRFLMGSLKPYFTKKEIKKMNKGKDYWLDSKDMLERGIATHIIVKGEVTTREDYMNPPKNKKVTAPGSKQKPKSKGKKVKTKAKSSRSISGIL